jgi:hypothetical protein
MQTVTCVCLGTLQVTARLTGQATHANSYLSVHLGTLQVTAKPTGQATLAFQQQHRPMPGSSAAAGRDGQLSAALGTKWAHAVNVRLILERIVEGGEERRFIKVREIT